MGTPLSPLLTTPASKPTPAILQPLQLQSTKPSTTPPSGRCRPTGRREAISTGILTCSTALLLPALAPPPPAWAASDEEYVKDTSEVITKVRSTISMDKKDPNVATAVSELKDASNSWVAKYRKEKTLLGRASFRDVYSALNAVSGHYISFGPTSPIPAKRKARILEEVDSAEKALLRGR